MPTKCAICESPASGATCCECEIALCKHCTTACQRCEKSVCAVHIRTTSRGRLLCGGCWEDRSAERKKRREAEAARQSTAFTAEDVEEIEHDVVQSYASMAVEEGEGPPEESMLLDPKRPILRQSRYQNPSKKSYLLAFIFFGISMIVVFWAVPDMRNMVWPFEASGPEYQSNMMPQMKDTNSLRETGNLSRLNVVSELLLFVVTWAFLLAYLVGFALIVFPSMRIFIPRVRERYLNWKYGK